MGQQNSRTSFEWMHTEEPHATRRKQILAEHPEIKSLMGPDPRLKWWVLVLVSFQMFSACCIAAMQPSWMFLILAAYVLGGTINHSLSLAIHEIAHNLAFGHSRPLLNRLLGMFANLPLIVPVSISFKKYHLEHHRYQGHDDKDMDLPTEFEGRFFHTRGGKFLWVMLQPLFYALRPVLMRPMPVSQLEVINTVLQLAFDAALIYVLGVKSFVYLISGTLLAMGLHPVAGHFISEHYMFRKGYETYSYYGPLNAVTFNVGYHNEHHDFPNIPGSRLPQLKSMAPEWYDDLPSHSSWVRVIYDFVMDPEIGPYSRVKRVSKQK